MTAQQQRSAAAAAGAEETLRVERDHEAIGRLAEDLLPALIAKLAASGLGEIEVRESGWKARLRKPVGAQEGRRGSVGGPADGHAGHGRVTGRPAAGAARPAEDRDRRPREDGVADLDAVAGLVAATSPAVGIYHPRRDLVVGMHVRAADRLGWVDVLGVQQDVVAPVEGVIGSSLAEAGEAVEYGQELVRIEPPERAAEYDAPRSERQPSAVGNA
jgi:biotin carboxyl carrier protein